jgi:hypothetical protein
VRTSEILNKAADLIEERGWGTGGDTWYFGDDEAPLCIEGGMMAAMGLVFGAAEGDEPGATDVLYACPAYRAVHEYLGLDENRPLYSWNDSWDTKLDGSTENSRTKEEVIETLRTVAVIEAAKEDIADLTGAQK